MTEKVRSKANPRSLVFTIGFSVGVVGLAMAKGRKPTRKGGDLCALGGWTVTIDGSRKFGGYIVIVDTFVGGTRKIRSSVFKYPTS